MEKRKIKYWFFTTLSKFEIEADANYFEFKSRGRFNGKEGDQIVFLNQDSNNAVFSHRATISNVSQSKTDDENPQFYNKIEFGELESLGADNYLENFTYSLKRIKKYEEPYLDFKKKYGSLNKVEYEAIVQRDFFVTRTKFGKYVNALPWEHKVAFIEYFISKNPDLYFGIYKDFKVALQILEKYIESRITQPAKFMNLAHNLLKELITEEDINGIRFSNGVGKLDYLRIQNEYFEEYLNDSANNSITSNSDLDYQSTQLQYEFNNLFIRSNWPIILN